MEDSSDDDKSGANRTLSSIENQGNVKRKSSQVNIPRPFDGNYVEYTENTTIHGVKYLGEPRRPWAEKVFWIIIFICCFTFLGYFVYEVISKWKRCPVILVEDDIPTPIYKIPFPAVTVCPQIKAKFDKFSFESLFTIMGKGKVSDDDKIVIEQLYNQMEITNQICHRMVVEKFGNKAGKQKSINSSYIDLLHEMSPNLIETLGVAEYKMKIKFPTPGDDKETDSAEMMKENEEKNIKKRFSTVLTNEGVCFTFNVPKEIIREDAIQKEYPYNSFNESSNKWSNEHGYQLKNSNLDDIQNFFPVFMFGAGKEFGLKLILKSMVNDMNRLCQPTQVGFKIILHSPSIYPTTYEDYILVNFDGMTSIAVHPKIVKTSESLRSYSPQQRQCYFSDERHLKYFEYYNRVNCKLECISNYTLKQYGCVHFSLPMDPGTAICGAKTYNDETYKYMYNFVENANSAFDVIEEITSNQLDRSAVFDVKCDCLPECNSIEYAHIVETEPINQQLLSDKLNSEVNFLNKTYSKDVFTEISIFIKDSRVYGKTRNQLYTFSELVSNFGGLMGLFMGASMLSFVELIYFCVIRQMCQSEKSCTRRKASK